MRVFVLFIFTSFISFAVHAEDNYEVKIDGSTIVDVCKWAERNTIMHFKINRNFEIYWDNLSQKERVDPDKKNSFEQKKKTNLEALNINSKRYHYLNCYEHLIDK